MIDEGYIKFRCILDKTEHCPVPVPNELKEIRNALYQKKLIGFYPDLNVGYGNISIKIPEDILISATQTGHIATISDVDFTLVTKFDIHKNTVWCKGAKNASSETMTHAALYVADKQINAIIHIHNKPLWEKYLDVLPTTDKTVPYGTPQMAEEMMRLYTENPDTSSTKTIIMGGHEEGIICFGKNLREAYEVVLKL